MLRWVKRVALLLVLLLLAVAAWGYVTTVQPTTAREACNAPPVAPGKLEADVKMLAETLAPRDFTHPENLERAADYVKERMLKTGVPVSEQKFQVNDASYRNLIAVYGPSTTPERIVIGAHYDACEPKPGADDNASGVAALLELAERFAKSPPPMRVELVAYTLEEPPFFRTKHMGSSIHAESLALEKAKVRAMFSLETLGFFSDQKDSQQFPLAPVGWLYPSTGNYIVVVGKRGLSDLLPTIKRAMRGASELPVQTINAPTFVRGVDFSDHLNYWKKGYPAFMVTDTAFLRNPNYHEATDLPATLDYKRMGMVVQGVECAVRTLAK